MRLPAAPPRTNATTGWYFVSKEEYFATIYIMTTAATTAKNHDAFLNIPKAVPLLKIFVSDTNQKSTDWFSGMNFKTRNLVILSRIKTAAAILQKTKCFAIFADTAWIETAQACPTSARLFQAEP